MTALLEAQERLSQDAPPLVRQHTAQKIDDLIWRLNGSGATAGAPFPVRQLESLPKGWGIVFDDVAAGLYALGVASLLRLWIH